MAWWSLLAPVVGMGVNAVSDWLGLGPDAPEQPDMQGPLPSYQRSPTTVPPPASMGSSFVPPQPPPAPPRKLGARGENIDEALAMALSKYNGGR